jgi:hypothetical protein
MTKAIRVENADTSNHKVVVQVWDKGDPIDTLVREIFLDFPTAMANEAIFDTRYLVIKEVK